MGPGDVNLNGEAELLRAAAERGIAYRARLLDEPVTPTATPAQLRAALGGPVPEHSTDPATVVNRLADVVEAGGLMGMGSGRFFGFVIGGASAGRDRRRLARDGVGSEHRAVRAEPGDVGDRGGRRPLDRRSARPAAGVVVRVRHRRADGQHHRARGRASSRARGGRLGRRDRRPGRLAPDPSGRRRRGARDHSACRAVPRSRYPLAGAAWPSTPTVRWCRPISSGCSRPRPVGRRSCAVRPETSTPARSIRSVSWRRSRTRTEPGCTSTAPSACGRPPVVAGAGASRRGRLVVDRCPQVAQRSRTTAAS